MMESIRLRASLSFLLLGLAASPSYAQSQTTITREQVLKNAGDYANHAWRAKAANLKVTCSTTWTTTYKEGDQIGLPYNWGGFDDLKAFDDKIAKGYGTGAHQQDGVLTCTAGVDCSGFVCRAWQVGKKYGTSELSRITTEIAKTADVKPGDAWLKPGSHVVLHAYFRDDGTPAWYEASGGASKVRFTASKSWSYLKGYKPVRYNNIQD